MVNIPYLGDPALVQLFPDAKPALQSLADAGFLLFIVTNQSGVGRGLITMEQMHAVNAELLRKLEVPITQIYQAISAPGDPLGAEDRKPAPGLILRAAREHDVDLRGSFFVGDRLSDIECGRNGGSTPILLRHPQASAVHDRDRAEQLAAVVVNDLHEAARWILGRG